MDIPPSGGRDGGGGTTVGGDLRLLTPEHSLTFHCYKSHYGPMSGGGADTGSMGIQAVVGTGRVGCGWDADGVLGGGIDEGCGGDGRVEDGDRLSRW